MRSHASFFPLVASGLTALALVTAIFFSPGFARAGEAQAPSCTCPKDGASNKPKLANLAPPLDVNDEIAALESVQLALSQVADGSTYVWHRSHGRLSGLVSPTASFKDHRGLVCRHVVIVLTGVEITRKTESIACRQADGVWELDG